MSTLYDYSLPVDHLNKRRPNSIAAPSLLEWNVSSPNEEKIEVLETYSNPRDSRQQLSQDEAEVKCFTSPDREYSQPYTTEGSSEPSSDEDFFGHPIALVKPQELNSPDSIAEAILPLVNVQSPARNDVKRHPSPYYYGDLYKNKTDESPSKSQKYKKSIDKSDVENSSQTKTKKVSEADYLLNQNFDNQKSFYQIKYWKNSSIDTPNVEEPFRSKFSQLNCRKSSSVDTQSTDSRDAANESVMPPNRLTSPCACFTPEDGLDDDMTRQRHVYETAFDCRIDKSDDDLDQMDKVSNHPVLVQLNGNKTTRPESSYESDPNSHHKLSLACPQSTSNDNNSVSALSQTLQDIQLEPAEETSTALGALSLRLRGYTPSPPSTAPLPTKFHGKDVMMNSIRSAPNLPSHQKSRLKDLRLPIKSLRGRTSASSSGSLQMQGSVFDIEFGAKSNLISEFKGWSGHKGHPKMEKERILEIKDRPRKDMLLKRSKDLSKNSILEFKERRRRHKYSSTESITSSSGGSMESIRSSTSEGNRSTTSSESHHSSSLSSHDSDSGANTGFSIPQTGFLSHANKLHILSPISDKSSQEPISETSDNNRNNNSQKCSPEEIATPEIMKTKRRVPQNKNLLNLGFHTGDPEIQGSDSGISIQSREGITSRFGFTAELSIPNQQDFPDLPFDMPKLRRRRIISQDACTSGSATSVDLRDLPFDMPKLRRRLRIQQSSTESSVSQASSSQSVVEADRQNSDFRPKLSLNLGDLGKRHRMGLGLALVGLRTHNFENTSTATIDVIDINLPLEKQSWFHGAITRVEAETVLRLLKEGVFWLEIANLHDRTIRSH
ncbi:hypothetical protein FQR65_LT10063 [Abscondita terminalis]|nr:hypothetical protein FQR65_LT10063 [Abscondita terminalis]